MSFALVHTRAVSGITGLPVRVEADLANGLPNFSIVGLPDTAVREARDRVRAAISNSGFEFPQRRITVNLAPADLPKDSGRFDLPIAIGILAASGQVSTTHLQNWEFVGELSLTGALLSVKGAFALAASTMAAPSENTRALVLPVANQAEAQLTQSARLGFAASLLQVTDFLQRGSGLAGIDSVNNSAADPTLINHPAAIEQKQNVYDFAQVKGQRLARRAAEIAAAGRHHFLMFGPPGVGKSMIASRLSGLLPDLTHQEACALATIQSLDQGVEIKSWRKPPYRSPHHSTPARALIGGGQPVRPGEISLAHHGVLFLDELPEFSRDTLESLREPLETAEVSIARVRERIKFPADFMLVAAMNPCPCGYFGSQHPKRRCKCAPDRIHRYRARISGPLMDRFDIAIHLGNDQSTSSSEISESSHAISSRVADAYRQQLNRQGCSNSRLEGEKFQSAIQLAQQSQDLIKKTADYWGWSVRAQHRVMRVARTIADLAGRPDVTIDHLSEAIELRRAIDLSIDFS